MTARHIHIYIGSAPTRKTKDAEYSKYHQAMEAVKAAQGLVDKVSLPSSTRKPDSLFREASQACKKAADLWSQAAKEEPQNRARYEAACDKWSSKAVELGRRSVGDAVNPYKGTMLGSCWQTGYSTGKTGERKPPPAQYTDINWKAAWKQGWEAGYREHQEG